MEAPDLEFCSPLRHFSYFFDIFIFPFQDVFGPLFCSSWRLLGHLLGSTWMLLGTSWAHVGASWEHFLASWAPLWGAPALWNLILGPHAS